VHCPAVLIYAHINSTPPPVAHLNIKQNTGFSRTLFNIASNFFIK
jgi:hypothetical protein